ncbi:MAG: DNA cytosine methyltransferase [Sulfuritalea sp.]|nr:DNA cytosine methyltransferase [Sulfuritalea sp.]
MLKTFLYRKLTQNKGAPRLWLEGAQPERAGFTPGKRFMVELDTEKKRLTLSLADTGYRVVSGKERSGKRIPVIDINSHELLSLFKGMDSVRVIMTDNKIHILPTVAEMRRRERLARLQAKLDAKEPIAVGSLSHGGGILSHALHKGMAAAGLSSKLEFANDIREDLLDHASAVNDAWNANTIMLAAPMQELALDQWSLKQLPSLELFEAGIPCSGASVAGRAKLGTAVAEAHPDVGHLIVPFLQILAAVNPAVVVLENVKPYASSASMWILRHSLRDMGYDVHETILDAAEFNELEHRERLCMVAVTRGMHFSFDDIERPERRTRQLGEVLDPIADDDPRWSRFDYLRKHQEKHAAKGNGFAMQVFTADSDHIGTLTRGYAKIRCSDPKLAHPNEPELLRQVTATEHARCKGISDHLVAGLCSTTAHEMLGQSICYAPFHALGRLLAKAMQSGFNTETQAIPMDLLAAA